MSVIHIELAKSHDVTMPARDANLLLDSKNGNAALLYIYILSHSGELDTDAAEVRLKMTQKEISDALFALSKLGIAGSAPIPEIPDRSNEIPDYTQKDIAEHIGSDDDFRGLVGFCENQLGKILSSVDLETLLGIYSWLGLPADVICLLVASCIEETKKKYGPGRVPTMRTIEKRAKQWVGLGIMTYGLAEEHLRREEKLCESRMRIARILRIGDRALSPTEERYISDWVNLGISDELIALAYDKTVVNTGSLKWNYMNKILKSWFDLGYKTAEDAESGERKTKEDEENDVDSAMRLRELNRRRREKREEKTT